MDCGPTCLAMICKYYGKNTPVQILREKTQIGKEGVNMLGISEAAESVGFHTMAAQLNYQQLIEEATLPCILHWNQNHFVILHKIKNKFKWFNGSKEKKFIIADPGEGIVTINEDDFKKAWFSSTLKGELTGIALILQPTPVFYEQREDEDEKSESKKKGLNFKSIFSYVWPYQKMLFQLLLALGTASLLQIFLPFLTQSVVDTGINTQNLHFVYIVLLAQMALISGKLIVEFIRSWILLHISTRINISILTDFLIKLMKLPASFFDSKKTGDIIQRIHDHQRIRTFLTGSSVNILFSLLNLVLLSMVLAFFNSTVFLVFLIATVLYSLWIVFFLNRRKQLDYRQFDVSSKEQSVTIQMIQGMQEIKLHGCEKPVRWNWEHIQAKLFKLSVKSLALDQWQQSGAFFINESKNILITFFSAKAVIDGNMTLGTMLAIQYIIGQLNSPIEQMIGFLHSWQDAKISMDRLNEIHHMEDEEPASKSFIYELPYSFTRSLTGGYQSPSTSDLSLSETNQENDRYTNFTEKLTEDTPLPGITFKNLTFTYTGAGNSPVLKDINLFIPKGKTTAIVGVSGSGKTTLLKLLLKFYEPQRGEIKIGESPLSIISHKAWRKHCGVVMQDSFIFSDTIARNIAIGADKVDMQLLGHAINIANISDLIESLPLGYNTKIGAEGNGLSMGQRQRILIARAVYKNPEFVFLDEATNSLDANNESTILANLERFLQGKTVLVVAHRLSTVKNADQIVVLHQGEISERGTHQELINLKGEYYTLVKNQLELGD